MRGIYVFRVSENNKGFLNRRVYEKSKLFKQKSLYKYNFFDSIVQNIKRICILYYSQVVRRVLVSVIVYMFIYNWVIYNWGYKIQIVIVVGLRLS